MFHWYKKEKTFRWRTKESDWFLEVSWWHIQFWTPKTMHWFSWWNPCTHKFLIQATRSSVPHPEP